MTTDAAQPTLRPYQMEVVRVPLANGGLGHCVQAKHLEDGDKHHHDHTFPGTPDGGTACLLLAFKIAGGVSQDWTPGGVHWHSMTEQDAGRWAAWRQKTGRK